MPRKHQKGSRRTAAQPPQSQLSPPPPQRQTLPTAPRSHVAAAAALSFLAALALYVLTVSRTVGPVDSGALVIAATTGGVAHPPGFPLFLLLGRVFAHLPGLSPAFGVNLLSSVTTAGACAALCLATTALAQPFAGRSSPRFGLAAGLVAAASLNLWSWATIAEVYGLSNCLTALVVWAVARWHLAGEDAGARRRWLVVIALLGGLGAANHTSTFAVLGAATVLSMVASRDRFDQALAFLALSFGAGLASSGLFLAATLFGGATLVAFLTFYSPTVEQLKRDLRAVVLAGVSVCIGLSLYLYLLVAARNPEARLNWGDPSTLEALARHVKGWQYQAYFSSATLPEVAATFRDEFLPAWLSQWGSFGAIVFLPGLALGLAALWRHARGMLLFVVLLVAANVTLGCTMRQSDDKSASFAATVMVTAMVATLGIAAAAARLAATRRLERFALTVLAFILAASGVLVSYRDCDRSSDDAFDRFARNVAAEVPEGALLLTANWQLFYPPLQYLRACEDFRPDLEVWDARMLIRSWYLESIFARDPELAAAVSVEWETFRPLLEAFESEEEPDSTAINEASDACLRAMLAHQAQRRPIYLTHDVAYPGLYGREFYESFLGRQLGPVLLPSGGSIADRLVAQRLVIAALRPQETAPLPYPDTKIDPGTVFAPGAARDIYHLRLRDQEYVEVLRRRLIALLQQNRVLDARAAANEALAIGETGLLLEGIARVAAAEQDPPAVAAARERALELYRRQAEEWDGKGEIGRRMAERYRVRIDEIEAELGR